MEHAGFRRMRRSIIGGLSLLAIGGFAVTAGAQRAPKPASPSPRGAAAVVAADISGVSLGMSIDAAEAALRGAGWRVVRERGDTWDEAVARAADRRAGTFGTINMPSTGDGFLSAAKGEEHMTVTFNPTPGGPKVGQVSYRAPQGGRTLAQLRTDLLRRYGAPTYEKWGEFRGTMTWARAGRLGPALSFDMEADGIRLGIGEGETARLAQRAALERAVNQKVGPVGRSF